LPSAGFPQPVAVGTFSPPSKSGHPLETHFDFFLLSFPSFLLSIPFPRPPAPGLTFLQAVVQCRVSFLGRLSAGDRLARGLPSFFLFMPFECRFGQERRVDRWKCPPRPFSFGSLEQPCLTSPPLSRLLSSSTPRQRSDPFFTTFRRSHGFSTPPFLLDFSSPASSPSPWSPWIPVSFLIRDPACSLLPIAANTSSTPPPPLPCFYPFVSNSTPNDPFSQWVRGGFCSGI